MKSNLEIKIMLGALYKDLEYIEKNIPAGDCHWRQCKAKIEVLQWVLEIE